MGAGWGPPGVWEEYLSILKTVIWSQRYILEMWFFFFTYSYKRWLHTKPGLVYKLYIQYPNYIKKYRHGNGMFCEKSFFLFLVLTGTNNFFYHINYLDIMDLLEKFNPFYRMVVVSHTNIQSCNIMARIFTGL